MNRPKNIFLIRHGQSEGNVNKEVHWTTPDWLVNLTNHGKNQAFTAGAILNKMLKNTKTAFYVSPYNRTVQTSEEILKSFHSHEIHSIRQDPRIREQEYGNAMTADSSNAVELERVKYGPFFYRIPAGESGADVYDRVTTFLETMNRDIKKHNDIENIIIVTHGMTLRVFLMRWFHWDVRYFHKLKNPRNCGIYHMKLNETLNRYELVTEMEVRE